MPKTTIPARAPRPRSAGECPKRLRWARLLAASWLGSQLLLMAAAERTLAQAEGDDSTRAAARRLGAQGIEAYWANDFSAADDKLDRAFRLYPTATLGLWSARARVQLGQLVGGAERYREALRAEVVGDVEAQRKARAEAQQELDKLVPRIPTLTVHIAHARPEDVEVTLDEVLIPSPLLDEARPTDPGPHDIVASRGSERHETHVDLTEGSQKQLTLEFRVARASAEPGIGADETLTLTPVQPVLRPSSQPSSEVPAQGAPSPLKPIGIITLAFGTAGLATAGITALIANSKLSQCPNNQCPPDVKDTYDGLRTVSTVAFYAGAGLALGGLLMWLAAPSQQDTAPATGLSWTLGPSGAAVSGGF